MKAPSSAECGNPRCTCTPCTCVECRCGSTKLGELEARVMAVLWDSADGPVRARAVADHLPDYAYTTVATVLERLSRKGRVERTSDGRVNLYRATDSSGSLAAKAMREALDATPDQGEALVRFVGSISPEQKRVVRRLLDDLRRTPPGGSL